jgi:hypothetical protein
MGASIRLAGMKLRQKTPYPLIKCLTFEALCGKLIEVEIGMTMFSIVALGYVCKTYNVGSSPTVVSD